MIARYLTHPEVTIDPNIPVPEWGLSDVGRARVTALIASNALAGTSHVVSSAERKAVETAAPIASELGASLDVREQMHENDRTATGYLPEMEFEATADAFFAEPYRSVRGWETAADAQARIVHEVESVLKDHEAGDILFVGHGGVGTLLYCHLSGNPISRKLDQFNSGGSLFTFEVRSQKALTHWSPLEELFE